jgi:hypothetical protein
MISLKEQESLLVAISSKLGRKITVFAIGGTAMMLSGSKDATKDIDLVFTDKNDIKHFIEAAKSLGYEYMEPALIYGTKENQPMVLKRLDSRIDLFTREIISFTFSKWMEKRAVSTHEFGHNIILKVADPHDIILLKSATDRIKDKDDIRSILNSSKINWEIIVEESKHQIKLGNARSVFDLLGTFLAVRKAGVDIPESVFRRIWGSIFPDG